MKTRTTLVLLMIALGVGGLVWLDYRSGVSTDEARARSRKLVAFDPAAITRLELVRSNETVVITRADERWELQAPLVARADFSAVSSIINELEFAERRRTIEARELAADSLAEFGLVEPRLTLTLGGREKSVTLRIGGATPTGDAVYVQLAGQPEVLLAERGIVARLDKSLDALRDRSVLELSPGAATRVQFKSAERVLELARQDGRWSLTQPVATRAAQAKVNDALTDLGSLRVQEFISEDPKDVVTYRLTEATREILVWQDGQTEPMTLLIGSHPTNDPAVVYAKRKTGPTIFTVSQASLDRLQFQPNDLRDPHALAFDPAQVGAIRLLRGVEEIAVTRTNQGWEITAPWTALADAAQVQALLGELRDLTVREFTADVATDLEKYGLAVPALIVTLADRHGQTLTQLLVGGVDEAGTARHVKLAAEPFIYGVDPAALDQIPATAWSFRHREIWTIPADAITRFEVTTPGAAAPPQVIVEQDADRQWTLVAPTQGALDADRVRQTLAVFAMLRAADFFPPGGTPPAATRTLTATVGDRTYVLAIGEPDADGRARAWTTEPALTFLLSAATVNTLTQTLVTTSVVAEE